MHCVYKIVRRVEGRDRILHRLVHKLLLPLDGDTPIQDFTACLLIQAFAAQLQTSPAGPVIYNLQDMSKRTVC